MRLGRQRPTRRDPRDLPAYGIVEAAHYLRLPAATLHGWAIARPYPRSDGLQFSEPALTLPAANRPVVSFIKGVPVKLFPFTREPEADEPQAIVIDPYLAFGRPVLVGTGVATVIIAERFEAGETMEALAADYGRARSDIEEAIRCELTLKARAA